MPERDLVFFSYRHDRDGERWLGALHGMLEPYVLGRHLVAWSDRDIRTGEQWDSRIQSAIGRTRVAVLLVNQRFFGSAYICQRELPRLIDDARAGRLVLVVVVVGAVDAALLAAHGLSAFQAADAPDRPMNGLRGGNLDKALVAVAVKVRTAYGTVAERADAAPAVLHGDTPMPRESAAAPGPLLDVPPYNVNHYVARPDDIAALRDILLQGTELALGVTAAAAPGLGLHGMGGMGKSVLALALCHDDALRRAFPDGVAWVALGQTPDLLAVQNRLLRLLDPQAAPAETQADGSTRLRQTLQDRRALLVVDDVWDAGHARALSVVEGRSRLLMTTRDATVLSLTGARTHALQRLPLPLARQLLALRAHCGVDQLPPEADRVVEDTGGLPLALALAGSQVADGLSWTTLVDELRQGHVDFLDHAYGSVYATLGRSVDALDARDRERYLDLAVFPEDEAIPAGTVARLWQCRGGLSAAQTEQLLVRLDRKALLTLTGSGAGRVVALHDLQLDFVRWRATDIAALHRALLDAHRPSTGGGVPAGSPWSRLPLDTPYLWPRLVMHLAVAGLDGELEDALLDADWIRARLAVATDQHDGRRVADIAAFLSDFDAHSSSGDVRRLKRALQASAHRLIRHPDVLDQQLHGRLGRDGGRLGQLASNCLARLRAVDLWAPSRPGLAPPGPAMAVLSDHTSSVNGALLLPDGRRALSWSDDSTMRLWDLDGAAEPRVLAGHEEAVNGALLLPDGRRALSWSDDVTLRLWDLDGATEPQVLAGHERSVSGALLLPAGRRALSWSGDGTLRLWDLDGAAEPRVLAGHEGWVYGALLLPDGRRALSWSHDRTLRLWHLDNAAEPRVLAGHEDLVYGALLLPDGRRALSWSGDRTLRLWDLDGAAEPRVLARHEGPVNCALLLPDGRRALSWSNHPTLRLWDLDATAEPRVLVGHEAGVKDALLLPDGRRALSWSGDGTLRLWDLDDAAEPHVLAGHQGAVYGALLLPDDRRALSWSDDRTLRLWDFDGAAEPRVLAGHEGSVSGTLLLPDGRCALSYSEDGTLRLWDLDGTAEPHLLAGHEEAVNGALLLPDGRRALSWSGDDTLRLWDLDGAAEPRVLAGHEEAVNGALLLPDGHRALSWSDDRTLRLWDFDDAAEPHVLARHRGSVYGALLLPDGRRALSWSGDRTLRLWDLDGAAEPRVLAEHVIWVSGALLLTDSRRTLSWSDDRTLRLWDLDGAAEPRVLARHEGSVNGALLLPDGRRALSWSDDKTLRLWDLDRAREIARYDADATVSAVVATARHVFLGDGLGYVQVLNLRD